MFKKIYEKLVGLHNKIGLLLSGVLQDEPDDERDYYKNCPGGQNQAEPNGSVDEPQQLAGRDYVVVDGVRYYREAKPETPENNP